MDNLQLSPLDINALVSSRMESNMASIPDRRTKAPTSVLVMLRNALCLSTGGRSVIKAAKRIRTGRRPVNKISLPRQPLGRGRFFRVVV